MVANLGYLQAADHAGGPNVVFAKADDPVATAARVAAATRADGTIVKNITQQTQQTVSSITTVDLRGIAKILEVFTIILAAAATGLFIALGAHRAPPRVRHDGRPRRPAARDPLVRLERGRASC